MRPALFPKVFGLALVGATVQCHTSSRPNSEQASADTWQFDVEEPSRVQVPPLGSVSAHDHESSSKLRRLWKTAQEFNSVPRRQFIRFPAWRSRSYHEGLADVIADHPNSAAALTAQLELGYIYVDSLATRSYGQQLLHDVETHAGTWQAVLAETNRVTQGLLEDGITAGSEREVKELFPDLERLEQELPAELVEWKEHLYAVPSYDFRAGLIDIMMRDCLKRDDRAGATIYAQRIVTEFSEARHAQFARATLKMLAMDYNPAIPPPVKW